MSKPTLIFDFDGTIANSFDTLVEIYNKVAMQHKCRPVNSSDVVRLRKLGPKAVVKELNVPFWRLPAVIKAVLSEFHKGIEGIQPQPGICDVIRQLQAQGYLVGIMTSNTVATVEKFLNNNGLESVVSFVYSEKRVNGKHKALRLILNDEQLTPQNSVYIGDEVRDMIAAKKVGMKAIAAAWGFNDKQALHDQQPDFLIEQPVELLTIVKQIKND